MNIPVVHMFIWEFDIPNFSVLSGARFPHRTHIHAFGFKTPVLEIPWFVETVSDWKNRIRDVCTYIIQTYLGLLTRSHATIVGGCFVEGSWLRNAFRWRDSIGPWEERPGHYGDVWNYWTDDGLGYYEFLQVLVYNVSPFPFLLLPLIIYNFWNLYKSFLKFSVLPQSGYSTMVIITRYLISLTTTVSLLTYESSPLIIRNQPPWWSWYYCYCSFRKGMSWSLNSQLIF